ncbi:MAG: glycosyltransferase family 4 protein [Haloarculaceae archaeon]
MRVAVVAARTGRYVDRDGVARTERVARGLAARGHDVTVYCTGWWEGYDEYRETDRVTYRAVTVSPADASFVARVPGLLAVDRPDVVHARPAPPAAVIAARAGARLARTALVVDWYGDDPSGRLSRRAARAGDRVVTPSRLVGTWVRELGATEEQTHVVPEMLDLSLVRSTEPDGDADIVAARHLDGSANLESLFLALAELRGREWTATVIGDGPARAAYEAQAADLRIDDRVAFVGALPREERLARYRAAHVFVHTATWEPFATELLWAMACGCVGVVEYQEDSAAHELVERRERGFRATTPEEIEDAIVDAGDLPEWTVDESFEAFDHDAVVERWLDCYREAGAR